MKETEYYFDKNRISKEIEHKNFMFLNSMRVPMDVINEIYAKWKKGGSPINFAVEISNRIVPSESSWSIHFICEAVDKNGYSGESHGVIHDDCDCSHCVPVDRIKELTVKQLKEDLSSINKMIKKEKSKEKNRINKLYKKEIIKNLNSEAIRKAFERR